MKDEALLAEYRVESNPLSKIGFDFLGVKADWYRVHINGNDVQVSISHELGDIHLCANIILSDTLGRVPTYAECLEIKDIFFEEDEVMVFGISRNSLMNMTVTNSWAMHMYKYVGPMPPIQKIMEIDNYKVDGDYRITKGKGWGWHFVRICGDHYPDMDEIRQIKDKYAPYMDVAVFLIKGAVILFNNSKDGIKFNRQIMK